MPYISSYTGTQIDDTISEVQEKKELWDKKQEKISGRQGQYVGFDALGNATPMEIDLGDRVTSFNGRTGDVMPGNGDYTAEMVGARPSDWMPTAEDVGALPDTVTIPTRTSQLINDSGFITDGEGGGSTPSGPVAAVDVTYSNVGSGLDATNAQEALDELAEEVSQLFTSGSEGKALIASAITAKGIETGADASFQEMAGNITQISTVPDDLYTIEVSASDPDGGTVSGGGLASSGMNVTVNADANIGYDFVNWIESSGEVVSTSPQYNFTVDRNRSLVAVLDLMPSSRLPLGYKEVEYIHFDGYDTSLALQENVSANTDRIFVKFYPESFMSVGRIFTFASPIVSGGSVSTYSLEITMTTISKISFFINSTTSKDFISSTSMIDSIVDFDFDFLNDTYTIRGISISGSKNSNSLGDNWKFLGCTTGATDCSPQGKFYQFTHYRNGEVIHDYVPCVNSDGIAGVFDINTETFIQNTHSKATSITPGPFV